MTEGSLLFDLLVGFGLALISWWLIGDDRPSDSTRRRSSGVAHLLPLQTLLYRRRRALLRRR